MPCAAMCTAGASMLCLQLATQLSFASRRCVHGCHLTRSPETHAALLPWRVLLCPADNRSADEFLFRIMKQREQDVSTIEQGGGEPARVRYYQRTLLAAFLACLHCGPTHTRSTPTLPALLVLQAPPRPSPAVGLTRCGLEPPPAPVPSTRRQAWRLQLASQQPWAVAACRLCGRAAA